MDSQADIERLKSRLVLALEERRIQAALSLEQYKATLVLQAEEYKTKMAERHAMATIAANFATTTMRSLLLINGGAIIGILTFLGNMKNHTGIDPHAEPIGIVLGVEWFAWGVALSVAASGLAYVSQTIIREGGKRLSFWGGGFIRYIAGVAALLSLAAFVVGALRAAKALSPLV